MAHFVLEYSSNLDPKQLDIETLFAALHQAALDTGLFPLKGIRSRAYACDYYRLADGNPEHGFVHLSVLVGAGRSLAERERAAKAFFQVISDHLQPFFQQRGMALSFELRELEPVLKYNQNNLQDYLPKDV